MAKAQPRLAGSGASAEPQLDQQEAAVAVPEPAITPDRARATLEKALSASQPERSKPELSDAERQKNFTEAVKRQLASPSSKDGSPSPARQLPVSRLQLVVAGYNYRIWDATLEEGSTFDDVLQPGFWAHCARKFNPWDQIWCRAEHGTFYAELIVQECAQLWIRVVPKPGYPLATFVTEPDVDGQLPAGWEIKWRGDHNGYCVVRGGMVIKEKCPNKQAALAWCREVMKANRVMGG